MTLSESLQQKAQSHISWVKVSYPYLIRYS